MIMRSWIILILSFVVLSGCRSVMHYNAHIDREIPVKKLKKDVDYVYKKLMKNHPKLDLYLPQDQIELKFDSIKNALTRPLKPNEFYTTLQPVIGALKHGHTDLYPLFYKNSKEQINQYKNSVGPMSQLSVFWENDSLYILRSTEKDSSIKPGTVILKIDSLEPKKIVDKYKTTFYGDGYNSTYFQNRLNRNFFSFFYGLENSIKDSITYTLSYNGKVFEKKLNRIYKDIPQENKKTKNDTLSNPVYKKPAVKKTIKPFEFSYNKSSKLYTRTLSFPTNDSTFAMLKVSTFSFGDYSKDYKKAFEIIENYKVKNLVLDLRNNGGGKLADSYTLFSYFVPNQDTYLGEQSIVSASAFQRAVVGVFPKYARPLAYPISLISYFISSKNGANQPYIKPQLSRVKNNNPSFGYDGNLYVIINGGSYSASAILSANLKGFNRAYFVGEETGGDANGSVAGLMPNFQLPNSHLKLSIGTVYLQPNYYKSELLGHGIYPDKEIKTTLDDRIKNIDPQLKWIIEDVKKENEELNKVIN